jgi:hypothetical protein
MEVALHLSYDMSTRGYFAIIEQLKVLVLEVVFHLSYGISKYITSLSQKTPSLGPRDTYHIYRMDVHAPWLRSRAGAQTRSPGKCNLELSDRMSTPC